MTINLKIIIIKLFFLLFLFPVFSQQNESISKKKEIIIDPDTKLIKEKTPALALGLKIGFFNGVSLSTEIISTLLNSRISFFGDISYADFYFMPFSENNDASIRFTYAELGVNYYFIGKIGQGLYLGIGGAIFDFNLSKNGRTSNEGNLFIGYATTDNFNLVLNNFKLGIKMGTKFFFRFEVGYALAEIPMFLSMV